MDKPRLRIVLLDKDFRILDHMGWAVPQEHESAVLALYVIPEEHLNRQSASFQRQAIFESLQDLSLQLQMLNIALTLEQGHAIDVINKFALQYALTSISFYRSSRWNPLFINALNNHFPNLMLHVFDHPTLLALTDLPFQLSNLPATYTNFRMQVENNIRVSSPLEKPQPLPCKIEFDPHWERLNTLLTDRTTLVQPMGETAALNHIHDYFHVRKLALTYKKTRNGMLHFQDSTRFSPYLAWGNVSARTIYHALKDAEKKYGANDSTYWIWFELLWRDYFYFLLHATPMNTSINVNWNDNKMHRWIEGETGFPLVDAAMRELKQTGWMSNRGRQNVASFFVHGLGLPWAWGEAYFRNALLDYDATSNLGNWQYLAGVGADPRENRVFNVTLQFKKYDPQGDYVKRWCPELNDLPVPLIYQPWLMNPLEQDLYACHLGKNYPLRMIDDQRFIFA